MSRKAGKKRSQAKGRLSPRSPDGRRDVAAAEVGSRETRTSIAAPLVAQHDAPVERNFSILRGRNWLWAFLLLAVTIVAYQQAWNAGYIWDDDEYVTQNELLTAPDGLRRIWFSLDSPSQYFPLVYTTFRIEHALWGLPPAGYHWVNILLHATNAFLVWRLLVALRVPGAWLAAALFALHPVHVESVAWITERKNVLMGLFFLLSLLSWNRFVNDSTRWRSYSFALVFYALALFAKTPACTLPAALVLILWLKRKSIDWRRIAQIAPFVLLGLLMGLVSIWWERHHQGTQGALFAIAPVERVLIAGRAVWFYLGKLLWPIDLAFSYPRWSISSTDPLDYLPLFALGLLAVGIFFARRRLGRGPEVAALFFVATLSPMLGLIMLYTFRYSFVADHYQYLATIGPFALAAAGATTALSLIPRAQAALAKPALYSALLLSLGVLTWRQCRIYADEETLWRATIATNPKSWMAHNNLGIKLLQKGQGDDAISHYDAALQLNPSYAEAHFNRGNALVRSGRTTEAVAAYRKAIELLPSFGAAQANLGSILLDNGQLQEAVAHLAKAVEFGPVTAEAHARLGDALSRLDQVDSAIKQLERALQLDPQSAEARNNLGQVLARAGRVADAIVEFRRALEITPESAGAQNNLGNALLQTGRVEEGIAHIQKALTLDPQNAAAHFNLGNAFLRTPRMEDAINSLRRAVEIRPDYVRARNNLANALTESGSLEEAVEHYAKALETDPSYAAAHNNLGRALARLGRTSEAEVHLRRAAEIDPQFARGMSGRP